jgi:hypothetical protein
MWLTQDIKRFIDFFTLCCDYLCKVTQPELYEHLEAGVILRHWWTDTYRLYLTLP